MVPAAKPEGQMGARGEDYRDVDPNDLYFTHSRVRPCFSGCGRRLEDTLSMLVDGTLSIEALPTITVLRGAGGKDGILFSLNNRRLWVLKELRRQGKLPGNVVRVRCKEALPRERDRYTAEKCSLTATLMGAGAGGDADEGEPSAATTIGPKTVAVTFLPQALKQVKGLKDKLVSGKGKERDVQSRVDDLIDAGLLQPSHEAAFWALLRQ